MLIREWCLSFMCTVQNAVKIPPGFHPIASYLIWLWILLQIMSFKIKTCYTLLWKATHWNILYCATSVDWGRPPILSVGYIWVHYVWLIYKLLPWIVNFVWFGKMVAHASKKLPFSSFFLRFNMCVAASGLTGLNVIGRVQGVSLLQFVLYLCSFFQRRKTFHLKPDPSKSDSL